MRHRAVVVVLLVVQVYIVLAHGFPFEPDGVVNPPLHDQRYRYAEYTRERPFFQWWYFNVKDTQTQRYWAFAYGNSQPAKHVSTVRQGTYMMVAVVDHAAGDRWTKYEHFDSLGHGEDPAWLIGGDYDLHVSGGDSVFSMTAVDENTYRITGSMKTPSASWMTPNATVAEMDVSWDFTLHRVYGWFGQQDLDFLLKASGLIAWNTYTHDAEVEGTITYGGKTVQVERSSRYRAYGDMNWGDAFPTGEPATKYNWGWYSMVVPNDDPQKDISLIAGSGTTAWGFPVYTTDASFADIRLGSDFHLGVRWGGFWDNTKMEYHPLATSSDGGCRNFTVTRSAWQSLTDAYGTASIPMDQDVFVETEHYQVVMRFQSVIDDYDRLLFAHQDYIYSDFEGLGVAVCATIKQRDSPSSSVFTKTLFDGCSQNGGIEFGFKTSVSDQQPKLSVPSVSEPNVL